ncbi:DNA polymerase III subunit alpha [Virgibacillus sp. C22-A2]|uniref:DNA polymerase III subunit alpha n=1 Tax=Virgibacillus tibetensis TaxID=3042313 RepID=A0ABU6K9A0_9BACI|nr:DNA polymerase III subunit alpha [Virgibacillus sp. C22-A2]
MSYTHLQVRSGYSLMHSTITIEKLVKQAEKLQFKALALTDENVLYGVIPFYKACKKVGIKPIIGMTTYVMNEEDDIEQCILLAKNNAGYQSLAKISTYIQQHQKSSIELEEIRAYANNLICILPAQSAKLRGMLETEPYEKVSHYISSWQNVFVTDDFYLGVQDHGSDSEKMLHKSLKAFQAIYPLPVVALNDVRYLNEKDDRVYDCLQAMKNGDKWGLEVADPVMKQRHLRSSTEMKELFQSWPEAWQETEVIKDKCNVTFDFEQRMLPSYPVPGNYDADTYLEKLCWSNVEQRYKVVTKTISERLDYELEVIQSMQFSDYFLIVSDFIAYAKEKSIYVGPGRGSAAGSLVAYVLGITDVDPIEYDLLFERFLNPERLTMPDIDIDFSDTRRDEVIEYVKNKYGQAHVAQIITFGTYAARSLIRELIKTLEVDQQDSYFVLNEIPVQAKKSLVELVNDSDELKEYIKQSKKLKLLFTFASKLEGLPRHISTHAAGLVISEKPLIEHIPLTVGANDISLTQFPMTDLESIGLLKIDLLGLKNLTLLERVIQSINFTKNKQLTLHTIPDNDALTYELLQKGKTNGVFQLESQGMKRVLTRLRPSSFEDIVAVNALYRPGPMEFIPTYIERKNSREKITYPHPDLAPILEKTYGVLVYQEQIMQIAHKIAGYTLGQADILRKAVSKKQQMVMEEQKEAFVSGCLQNGYKEGIAEEIFDWIVKFSNYGFNRSHSVAYSKISYQLAYLKAHYPANFYAELLSSAVNQQDKIQLYSKEIKELDITIAPPSINKSYGKFTVEGNQIRMGLLMIKGIANQVIKEISRVRREGPFKNLFDFCLRVSLKIVNRKALELLVLAGAFDETYANRASLLASIDQAIEQGDLFREFNDQSSLFQRKIELEANYVEIEDFSQIKKLSDEKELLGTYISSHPLKKHRQILRENGYISLKNAESLIGKRNIKSTGVVQAIKTIRTKRGDPMAFITIGDETGDMEAVLFPELYREVNRWLTEEMIIMFNGKIEQRNNRTQWLFSEVSQFDKLQLKTNKKNQRLFIKLTEENSEQALNQLKTIASDYPGSTPIIIFHEEQRKTYQLANDYYLNPSYDCLEALTDYFGKRSVVLEK